MRKPLIRAATRPSVRDRTAAGRQKRLADIRAAAAAAGRLVAEESLGIGGEAAIAAVSTADEAGGTDEVASYAVSCVWKGGDKVTNCKR